MGASDRFGVHSPSTVALLVAMVVSIFLRAGAVTPADRAAAAAVCCEKAARVTLFSGEYIARVNKGKCEAFRIYYVSITDCPILRGGNWNSRAECEVLSFSTRATSLLKPNSLQCDPETMGFASWTFHRH